MRAEIKPATPDPVPSLEDSYAQAVAPTNYELTGHTTVPGSAEYSSTVDNYNDRPEYATLKKIAL